MGNNKSMRLIIFIEGIFLLVFCTFVFILITGNRVNHVYRAVKTKECAMAIGEAVITEYRGEKSENTLVCFETPRTWKIMESSLTADSRTLLPPYYTVIIRKSDGKILRIEDTLTEELLKKDPNIEIRVD